MVTMTNITLPEISRWYGVVRLDLVNPSCLGGAAVRHRTRDRKVAGLTPGWGAIKSTRSTQPSIPQG